MTDELRLERLFDAPPEAVFDAFSAPGSQEQLHGAGQPDWQVSRSETDVRVGGTSVYAMGPVGGEPDVETRVYSVVDRPNRLVLRHSMAVAGSEDPIETEMTVTFEDRDGTTLLTMVQTGFEREQDRDGFVEGWSAYLDTLRGIVNEQLKARHDTDESGRSET